MIPRKISLSKTQSFSRFLKVMQYVNMSLNNGMLRLGGPWRGEKLFSCSVTFKPFNTIVGVLIKCFSETMVT